MNNEYIIVNKTAIQKRIEELESKIIPNPNFDSEIDSHNLLFIAKQNELNKILSQSTPLIPEINAAIEFGKDIIGSNTFISTDENGTPFIDYFDTTTETNHYISNLKLDI